MRSRKLSNHYKIKVCTPCPVCGCGGGIIFAKDIMKQDGDELRYPCGCKLVLIKDDWVIEKRCCAYISEPKINLEAE